MHELPTIKSVAAANPDKIHKLWEGLGYYTRARNLQKAAQMILRERAGYNEILGATTQQRTMDVTPWLGWFIGCTSRAIESSQSTIANVLAGAAFSNASEGEKQRFVVEASLRWLQG